MTALQLFVGLLTLVVNAFFVGAEFALISVRRSQIEPYAEAGDRRAGSVLWGLQHVSALLAAAQLGITLCTLVLGAVAEPAIAHLLEPGFDAVGIPHALIHPISFVIALAVATYLHMLFGEMVPKNVALAEPVRSALLLGPPLVALTRALRPVIFAINALANGLLRLLRVEVKDEVAATFSDAQLAQLVEDSRAAGLLDERAQERLRDALELGRRPVRDVVLPVSEVVSARIGTTAEELEHLAAESGFSRFPVVDDTRRILGYLHVKDALDAAPRSCRSRCRRCARSPGSGGDPLDDVLTAMRGSRTHLAAVIGDDGKLAGLVTMEDVLRELVLQRPAA
ncbi:hemolysin family protein [Streptomyces noursei]|nr:hemolysin family protein [Streptomyces noursei]